MLLKSLGRIDEARAEVRKAIDLNPKLYSAYANLNDLETFGADHDLLAKMEEIFAEASDPESERYMALHFAFGKALEDAGDYVRALKHYEIGTRLRREQLKYDEAETLGFFDQIMAAFPAEIFENRPFEGNPATRSRCSSSACRARAARWSSRSCPATRRSTAPARSRS